jgi:hypothetical protein
MKVVDEVKQFFWLRRIALASEKQADAMDRIARILEAEYRAVQHPKPPRKRTEFSIMDQEAINKDFERRLQAERDGIELDD